MNEPLFNKKLVILFIIGFILYMILVVSASKVKTYEQMDVNERIRTELQASPW